MALASLVKAGVISTVNNTCCATLCVHPCAPARACLCVFFLFVCVFVRVFVFVGGNYPKIDRWLTRLIPVSLCLCVSVCLCVCVSVSLCVCVLVSLCAGVCVSVYLRVLYVCVAVPEPNRTEPNQTQTEPQVITQNIDGLHVW